MKIYRDHRPLQPNHPCALTIGNFDGVHRGHQAMLSLLCNEARHRGLPSCVLTFEPHPRDFFARENNRPQDAPARISTLRDKLAELQQCGINEVVITRFNRAFANLSPLAFVQQIIQTQLQAHYVLVGDDFSFGAKRAGNYALLDAYGRPVRQPGELFCGGHLGVGRACSRGAAEPGRHAGIHNTRLGIDVDNRQRGPRPAAGDGSAGALAERPPGTTPATAFCAGAKVNRPTAPHT
jgi:hypothetical protein